MQVTITGPEAALYSLGHGVKSAGGLYSTEMLTAGAPRRQVRSGNYKIAERNSYCMGELLGSIFE